MSVPAYLRRLSSLTLDLLFPPRCFGCDKENTFLCEDCYAELPHLEPPYCRLCSQPLEGAMCGRCRVRPPTIDGIRAPFLMRDSIRRAVLTLKYNNLRAMAPTLGRLLADFVKEMDIQADVVVPVPLHRKRLAERGYNQAGLFAKELTKVTSLQILNALERVRSSPPQARALKSDQRKVKVDNAFVPGGESVRGLRVPLVDDVCTTGATLGASAQILTEAGAANVWGLTLAREALSSQHFRRCEDRYSGTWQALGGGDTGEGAEAAKGFPVLVRPASPQQTPPER